MQPVEPTFINLHIDRLQTTLVQACFEHGIFEYESISNLDLCLQQHREIYEWWLVSDWLASRLQSHGEAVLWHPFGVWWGRTITGQRIALDDVIQAIAAPYIQQSSEQRSENNAIL